MMSAQSSGTGAKTELEDEKVRKNDILSNRDKAQRPAGRGLDGKGVQADEYKDNPANQRPPRDGEAQPDDEDTSEDQTKPSQATDTSEPTHATEQVDRPGFDQGGSTGETHAGKGLGLGDDAMEDRKGWRLPR